MTAELHWFFVRFGLPVAGFGALAFLAGLAVGLLKRRKQREGIC